MSTFYPYPIDCPTCGERFRVELVEGIHITRLPEARQQILDGTFQIFACPKCAERTAVEASLVYTDFDRWHYLAMECGTFDNWQAAQLRHQTVFDHSFTLGPPQAQEMGRRMKKRLVFGLRALREKLVIWDAGLDDRIVEALKGEAQARLGVAREDEQWRVRGVLPGGHLALCRYRAHESEDVPEGRVVIAAEPEFVDFETVVAAEYRRVARLGDALWEKYPWLQEEWLVDLHAGPAHLYEG